MVNGWKTKKLGEVAEVCMCKRIFAHQTIVCFKTIKVTKQGYRQDRQQRENRVLSSHIWWQNGGCFSA